MDRVARAFFELQFRLAFLEKKGNEFQNFFAAIMETRHPGDFFRVRPWGKHGDRKNDGYLRPQRALYQVYAPNEMTAKEAVAKIDEDFLGALPHWEDYFDTWVFVHNSRDGLGPDVTKKLLDLDMDHTPTVTHWGFAELRSEAFMLSEHELASILGPAPSRQGMLSLGLEALAPVLDQVALMPAPDEPDLRPPPADKIERNMLSDHVATLLRSGMMRVDLVHKYFRFEPSKQDEIAESFHLRYEALKMKGVAPDDIFTHLQRHAGGETVPSAARQSAVLAVLAFFFEKCDIFERDGGGTS